MRKNKKYTFTIFVGRVWVVILFFLLEKQTFNGLLKVFGIQIILQRSLTNALMLSKTFFWRTEVINLFLSNI